MRAKKIAGPIKVNVYSAALYVDKSKALNSLRIFKQATWESLKTSSEFSEIVRYHSFDHHLVSCCIHSLSVFNIQYSICR